MREMGGSRESSADGGGEARPVHPRASPAERDPMSILARSAKVAQAQGIITVQADCTLDDALRKMLDRAQINQQSMAQIADAVVAHQIWFR